MQATIKSVKFIKEYESKYGILFLHEVKYDEKTAYYSSKKKEQTTFKVGEVANFNEEARQDKKGKEILIIRPDRGQKFSGYARELRREQSRYSGFAVSYCKDLIIADKLKIEDWEKASKKIFDFMVALDKSLQDDKS